MTSPQLRPEYMRGILAAACPPCQHWDAHQLDNLCKKLRKMGENMKANNRLFHDMEHFFAQFQDDSGFFDGLFENEERKEWGDTILFNINDFYKNSLFSSKLTLSNYLLSFHFAYHSPTKVMSRDSILIFQKKISPKYS